MGVARKSFPRFRREGETPRIELTDDDVVILRHIYRHRFLRAEHLYRLLAHRSEDKLSRRLAALYRAGFLDRPIAQVDRYRDGGSKSLVYGLDHLGARQLKEVAGVSVTGADWRARNRSYTRENLEHTLAVAEFLVGIEVACRSRPALDYLPFDDVLKRAPVARQQASLPGRWAVPVRWHGGEGEVHLVPDAIFGLRMSNDGRQFHSFSFVEVDRGTMTIEPALRVQRSGAFLHRATVLRKFLAYGESWRQQLHQQHFGMRAPRVLFLTSSAKRAEAMRHVAERSVVLTGLMPAAALLFGQLGEAHQGGVLFDAAGAPIKLFGSDASSKPPG